MIIDISKTRKTISNSLNYYILLHKLKNNEQQHQTCSILLFLIILTTFSNISVNAQQSYSNYLYTTNSNSHNLFAPAIMTFGELVKQKDSLILGYKYLINKM